MNKQTLTLVAIAGALVALLLVFENPFKGARAPRWREEEKVQLVTPIAEDECAQIELSGFGTSATLVQKDHKWFTRDGYRADPDAIAPLFKILEDVAKSPPELLSINPDAFMKFRVDPFLGTRLRLIDTDGKTRVDLIIGELQNDFFFTPVRRPDSNKVFRVKAMFRGVLQRPTWRDLNIFRLDAQQVRRIAVQRPDQTYALAQETTTSPWHFCEPTSAPADLQQVQSWVWRVARFRATDLVPTTGTDMLTTYGLTAPTARLTISLENGSSYTLVFGRQNPANNQYYARRLDDPQVYSVDPRTYADILKPSVELRPKPETPAVVESPTSAPVPVRLLPTPKAPKAAPKGITAGPLSSARPAAKPTSPTVSRAAPRKTAPTSATTPTSGPATLRKAPSKAAKKAAPSEPSPPRESNKPTTASAAK